MRVFKFDELDSTNTYLKEMKNRQEFDLVVTKCQSAGRGRRGNKWSSEEGAALFSIVLEDKKDMEVDDSVKIPLVMGIAVLKGIEEYFNLIGKNELKEEINFKWTNDVYFFEKKLVGILVEKTDNHFIVGIGINVKNKIEDELINKAISLGEILDFEIQIDDIISCVVKSVMRYFEKFQKGEWSEILKEINKRNLLKNREIEVHYGDSVVKARGSEILYSGALEVYLETERRELSIGEVHLKI